MATRTIRIDDLDQSTDDVQAVTISIDGTRWTIDLSTANRAKLAEALAPFTDHAQRRGAPPHKERVRKGARRPGITGWAKERGLIPPTHAGRIPDDVMAAWDAEHRDAA